MAISLQNQGGRPNTNYFEFYCDLPSDISYLPTMTTSGTNGNEIYGAAPMGSSCYCITTGNLYILGSSGWTLV